jgi:Tol biopolymer transport system component/serine/threonine protein kinase
MSEPSPADGAPTFEGVVREAPTHRLQVGTTVGGRFRILRFIAAGGMGEVYAARDMELGGELALKTVQAVGNPDAEERFRREVQLARSLAHPGLCRIYDMATHRDAAGRTVTFLTMELLAGETLAARLRRAPLDGAQVAAVARQMGAALAALHAAGIVHRDLKPGNIMLVGEAGRVDRVVIMDFGLARLTAAHLSPGSEITETGVAVGTPDYMAPEQFSGDPPTFAADVYSFGVVLYRALTGILPFGAPSRLESLRARITESARPPRELEPRVDGGWEALVLRCLRRDPAGRPADGRALAAELDRLGPHATSGTPRRRALPWGAAGAALVAAVVALGTWTHRASQAPAPAASPPPRVQQLTTSSGLDAFPAFAPDGRAIAYSTDRGSGFTIVVKSLTPGSRERDLTPAEEQAVEPTWSPDGQHLAYVSLTDRGIWIVPAAGGPRRRLTGFGSHPAWSPDGREIAFQSGEEVDIPWNSVSALPGSVLWTIPAAGGEARRLAEPGMPEGGHANPSWSPRGDRLVFTAHDRVRSTLWTVSRAGGSPDAVPTPDQKFPGWPIFGRGGDVLHFAHSTEIGDAGIWSVPLSPQTGRATGPPRTAAALGLNQRIRQLSLAPGGNGLVYSAVTMAGNLWSVEVDAQGGRRGEPRQLTRETARSGRPVFSPDGRRIAFYRWRPGAAGSDLWVMEADGSAATQVTDDPANDFMPSWFPDGQRLAFLSNRSGRLVPWSLDLRGGGVTLLRDLGQDTDYAWLSPDGRWIAFNRATKGVLNTWLVPATGGAPSQLTADAELAAFPCWSPDASELALEVRRGQGTHVAVVPRGGGPLEMLTSDAGESWPYSYSPDGQHIAYSAYRGSTWSVRTVSRRTRAQAEVIAEPNRAAYLRSPAWSPDGRRLVYERAETVGNVWLLEGLGQ